MPRPNKSPNRRDRKREKDAHRLAMKRGELCHICECPGDLEDCAFDLDMNPYSTPRKCCGYHHCAEDT